jgi:hypothetical protein
VTAPPSRDSDNSSDVVDRITGKSHARPTAPAANGGGKSSSKSAPTAEPAPPPPTGVKGDDDPLRGLGL